MCTLSLTFFGAQFLLTKSVSTNFSNLSCFEQNALNFAATNS